MKKIWLVILYGFTILGLFLYSYTQVDLSLTLSRSSIYQSIEKGFQYIGYFNRPLSTILFCILVGLLFLFYLLSLSLGKKLFTMKSLWVLILGISVILTFSYNAFSYDLFNYIFAAKVVVHYHQSPYVLTALDFPKEPMLSFMHWTHNTYQYGPAWLGVTLPFYFFGFGYFIVTFFLFKILATLAYLGSVYFFQKILHKVNPQQELMGIILYALNPLVIVELLVSSHNDSTMILLGMMGIYFALQRKWIWAMLIIVVSYFTKQVTILLLIPVILLFVSNFTKKKFFSEKYFLWTCSGLMLGGFIYAGWKLGIQPWYAIWFLPFFFMVKLPRLLLAVTIGFSLGLLLRYVPFLWQGDWNGMAPSIMILVTVVAPIIFLIATLIINLFNRRYSGTFFQLN